MIPMKIDSFSFGSIAVDGRKYKCDVLIHADGSTEKRKGGLLMFGSHRITKENVERLIHGKTKPDLIIIGLGTASAARVDEDAKKLALDQKIDLIELPSKEAVEKLNKEWESKDRKVAALIHVTC